MTFEEKLKHIEFCSQSIRNFDRYIKEAEEKAIKETEEKLTAQSNDDGYYSRVSSTPKPPVNNKKKNSYIIIQVNGLEKEIAKGLLKYCQDNEINFEFEER